jgi:ribosomal protein S18 acetylase RimI-like enzyme
MSSNHTIRNAISSDTETMLVIHVAAIIACGPSAYSDKQVAAWAAKTEGTDRYTKAIESDAMELFVAEAEDKVVGFSEINLENNEIKAIFIDLERNGEGIGSSMLNHLEQRLRNRNCGVSRLRAVLNAVGFYERNGYGRVERVTNQTTNNVEVDSIWMQKSL